MPCPMAATENFRRKNDNCGKSFKKNRPKTDQISFFSAYLVSTVFRSGGATAVADASFNDGLFKSHGRWPSEKDKYGYVKDN